MLTGTIGSARSLIAGCISNGFFPLAVAFYRSLREGGELPVSGENGVATVAALDEIWAIPST